MRTRCWIETSSVSLVLLLSVSARAAVPSADSAAAQMLFDDAKQLMADGKYAQACPKLEESQRLDPTSGTLINLAACYEKDGRIATAWATFRDAATAASRAGNLDREKAARERATALGRQLSKIVIVVSGADKTPDIEVKRDGTVVGKALWGSAIPADGGTHTVTVSAPNLKTWEKKFDLKSSGDTVTITVPQLESSLASPAAPQPAGAQPPQPDATVSVEPRTGTLSGQKVGAMAAAGVGLAGIVVGSIYGLTAFSKHDEAAKVCTPYCTDQAGLDLKADSMHAGNIATAAFIVGAVGLAGGTVLWLTDRSGKSSAPQVGIGPTGLVVKGAW
jgi:hypothetical protein